MGLFDLLSKKKESSPRDAFVNYDAPPAPGYGKRKMVLTKPKDNSPRTVISTTPPVDTSFYNDERHIVAGTNYRQPELKDFGTANPDYMLNKSELIKRGLTNAPVYEYTFAPLPATLVFEPTNPHDPNAIKVLVNSVFIGYIKKGSTSRIRNLINEHKINKITARVYGGNSKSVYRDEYENCWMLEKNSGKLNADIYIELR